MSRSAADATRFTATSPQAHSKGPSQRPPGVPGGGRSNAAPPPPPPPGGNNRRAAAVAETAQEKVARLRAAHAAKRAAEITTWDRVVIRGRAVADAAHRVTVLGLVGLSVVAGVVTAYSIYDLSRHNRRKKQEWLDRQYENLQKELVEAARAERVGGATPEQMLLLNRERAAEQSRVEKEKSGGAWAGFKGLFTPDGLKKEESGDVLLDGEMARADAVAHGVPVAPVPDLSVPSAGTLTDKEGPVLKALNEHRRQGERALQAQGQPGGLLDRVANDAFEGTKRSASGWSTWLWPRSGGK